MTDKSNDPQTDTDPEELPDGSGPTNEPDDTASGGDEDQFQG